MNNRRNFLGLAGAIALSPMLPDSAQELDISPTQHLQFSNETVYVREPITLRDRDALYLENCRVIIDFDLNDFIGNSWLYISEGCFMRIKKSTIVLPGGQEQFIHLMKVE